MVVALFHVLYRYKSKNLDFIPKSGAAVIAANHITYVDALAIAAGIARQPRFVMHSYYYRFGTKWFFKICGVIPICPKSYDQKTFDKAFDIIEEALNNEELVVIFPEGRLTDDGEIGEFRPGIKKILKRTPVPIIPVAIRGLWGTFWSKKPSIPKRRRKIEVIAEKPIDPENFDLNILRKMIYKLRGDLK